MSIQASSYRQVVHLCMAGCRCPGCSNKMQTRQSTTWVHHHSGDSGSADLLAANAVQDMAAMSCFYTLVHGGAWLQPSPTRTLPQTQTCMAHLLTRNAVRGVGRQLIQLILSITQVVHATIVHDVIVPCEPALCLLQQQHTEEARQEREPQQSVRQLLVIICTRAGPAVAAAGGISVTAGPGSRCGSPLPLSTLPLRMQP